AGGSYYPLEEVRKATEGPSWYQLYCPPTRDQTAEMIDRAKNSGYDALVVTVDTAVNPIRPRDYYNRVTVPVKITPTLIRHGISRPFWAKDFLFGRVGQASQSPMRTGTVT